MSVRVLLEKDQCRLQSLNMRKLSLIHLSILFLVAACNLPVATPVPTPHLFQTMQASTPVAVDTAAPTAPVGDEPSEPTGKIAFTCQVFKELEREQICMVNADGTNYQRLTTEDDTRHFYPSISPDGLSVLYSALDEQSKHYEIYEFDLVAGEPKALTFALGDLNAPEVSPDGNSIAFTRFFDDPEHPTTWLMDRDGGNPRQVADVRAWDPTWSPDGTQILFASYADGLSQLFIINLDGSGLRQVSHLPALRGRSDWSAAGLIVTYSGKPWERELFSMNPDGSDLQQISPAGGNSQGPSFSPDGKWVAFTAYFDRFEVHGCEIYIMRVDGTDLRRLTDNDYCDYQPRWGP